MTATVDQLPPRMRTKIELELCPIASLDGFCWRWMSAQPARGGYGAVWHNGGARGAHRVVYETLIGPIPAGLDLDHRCLNKACCNPAHLEPVTRLVNVYRRDAVRRTSDEISSGEVARLLGVNQCTVSRWITSGRLVPIRRLPGRRGANLFRRTDIEALAVHA